MISTVKKGNIKHKSAKVIATSYAVLTNQSKFDQDDDNYT